MPTTVTTGLLLLLPLRALALVLCPNERLVLCAALSRQTAPAGPLVLRLTVCFCGERQLSRTQVRGLVRRRAP